MGEKRRQNHRQDPGCADLGHKKKLIIDQQLVMVCLWMFMIVNGSMMFQYVPNVVSFQGFPNETQGMCSTRLYVDHQVVAARVHPLKAGCTAAAHWNAGVRGNSRNKKGLISGE